MRVFRKSTNNFEFDDKPLITCLAGQAWFVIVLFWKYFIGIIFCTFVLTSIAVVGWCMRYMRHSASREWYKQSQKNSVEPDDEQDNFSYTSFKDFMQADATTYANTYKPNWFFSQSTKVELDNLADDANVFQIAWKYIKHPLSSLFLNFKLGFLALINVWIITLPAAALWMFSWHAGWNNSFYKVYEQAYVGPSTGILGILLFIPAAIYLPMSQARQAVTGNWKSFFEFKLVWKLIRLRWLSVIGLSIFYSLFSLPIVILKTAPGFFPQAFPELSQATPTEALEILQRYFFWVSAIGFPLYLFLRIIASRIYAKGIVLGIQHNVLNFEDLSPYEQNILQRLNLDQPIIETEKNPIIQTVLIPARGFSLAGGLVLLAIIWFSFIAQIYVSEFLVYHPGQGWLNQPLIQMPWFSYIPQHLTNEISPNP